MSSASDEAEVESLEEELEDLDISSKASDHFVPVDVICGDYIASMDILEEIFGLDPAEEGSG